MGGDDGAHGLDLDEELAVDQEIGREAADDEAAIADLEGPLALDGHAGHPELVSERVHVHRLQVAGAELAVHGHRAPDDHACLRLMFHGSLGRE